jgi:SAM-dependent methyltransferase
MPGRRDSPSRSDKQLTPIDIAWDLERPVPLDTEVLLRRADSLLQAYWDAWHRKPIEQYVACDFRDVWRALATVRELQLAQGNLFLEWGCGFGIVTAMASQMGWGAIGIEAEPFLVSEARTFLAAEGIQAEIWQGNFLPSGSERLARHQSHHASLFHQVPSAYSQHDMQLDDFAFVFAYPWPGEDGFLKDVFREYAAPGALLLVFRGPYELELYRKTI